MVTADIKQLFTVECFVNVERNLWLECTTVALQYLLNPSELLPFVRVKGYESEF